MSGTGGEGLAERLGCGVIDETRDDVGVERHRDRREVGDIERTEVHIVGLGIGLRESDGLGELRRPIGREGKVRKIDPAILTIGTLGSKSHPLGVVTPRMVGAMFLGFEGVSERVGETETSLAVPDRESAVV